MTSRCSCCTHCLSAWWPRAPHVVVSYVECHFLMRNYKTEGWVNLDLIPSVRFIIWAWLKTENNDIQSEGPCFTCNAIGQHSSINRAIFFLIGHWASCSREVGLTWTTIPVRRLVSSRTTRIWAWWWAELWACLSQVVLRLSAISLSS